MTIEHSGIEVRVAHASKITKRGATYQVVTQKVKNLRLASPLLSHVQKSTLRLLAPLTGGRPRHPTADSRQSRLASIA